MPSQNQCFQPVRLLLTIQTRIAGQANMAVWLHFVDGAAGSGADSILKGDDHNVENRN